MADKPVDQMLPAELFALIQSGVIPEGFERKTKASTIVEVHPTVVDGKQEDLLAFLQRIGEHGYDASNVVVDYFEETDEYKAGAVLLAPWQETDKHLALRIARHYARQRRDAAHKAAVDKFYAEIDKLKADFDAGEYLKKNEAEIKQRIDSAWSQKYTFERFYGTMNVYSQIEDTALRPFELNSP